MQRLQDKTVVITGAALGLGRAYSVALAKEGANVAVTDLDVEHARQVEEEITKSGGKAAHLLMDVSDETSVSDGMKAISDRFGGIDILINNAAISDTVLQKKGFAEIPVKEWDKVMAVNVRGPWLTTRAAVPYMKKRGGGKVIHIISTLAYKGSPGFLHYSVSKAALIGMTRTMAIELGEFNINVNMMGPGLTSTDRIRQIFDDAHMNAVAARRPLKRVETPEDLIGTLLFLSTSDSDFMTGQTLLVSGGDYFL